MTARSFMGTQTYDLIGGPQDGSKVRVPSDGGFPSFNDIYVGRANLGDGFAAWSSAPSERFPVRHTLAGGKYYFRGWWPRC